MSLKWVAVTDKDDRVSGSKITYGRYAVRAFGCKIIKQEWVCGCMWSNTTRLCGNYFRQQKIQFTKFVHMGWKWRLFKQTKQRSDHSKVCVCHASRGLMAKAGIIVHLHDITVWDTDACIKDKSPTRFTSCQQPIPICIFGLVAFDTE